MAQITRAERIARIKQLVNEQNKMPPTERHEAARLPSLTGDPLICPVISLSVDEVVLNHNSHRVRAHLEDEPEWQELQKDPQSEAAQSLIQRLVRERRSSERFAQLKESLAAEGQTDPGVVTYDGVLINANTRVVALREFEEPHRRFIRVAVLPETVKAEQLSLLELRLQMRKELKEDYSLTNELLFIEELASKRNLPHAQIARELRIEQDKPKKGELEITQRLQFLDLIRLMQRIPDEPLKLTFFDELSYQHLRELHRNHSALLETDPPQARRYLESYLLSAAVGVKAIHLIRKIDADFMSDYMLPQLEEDELVGEIAGKLVRGANNGAGSRAPAALAADDDDDDEPEVDVRGLVDAVTRRDKRIEVPGTKPTISLEQEDVREVLNTAISLGIKLKQSSERSENQLEAPVEAVKRATREVTKAADALKAVIGDPEFDQKRQKSLEAAFKKLRRGTRKLEQQLIQSEILDG